MFVPDLLDHFTTHLKEVLQKAFAFTMHSERGVVLTGDLVVGLLQEKGSIGAEILLKSGYKLDDAKKTFGYQKTDQGDAKNLDLSLDVKRIIEKCVLTAHINEHKYVGTEHLLSALLYTDNEELTKFFNNKNGNLSSLREQVAQVLKSTTRFPDFTNDLQADFDELERSMESQAGMLPRHEPKRHAVSSALETFARELTKPETADQLDPVIGRQRELKRMMEILCRRTKNNPVLLGDPGVGKTALVEGLAQLILSGDTPDALYGKRILLLDLAMTVAGTMYRGEFEARLKQVVEEARRDPNVILFIDEIHTIVGAGSTTGTLDAANILKPALARGEIRCIGATTWSEYKKHIEPDAALERRFQPITLEEPTPEAALEMIKGLEERYANHHNVRYTPQALQAAVTLSERYLTDRLFPDKAIDLLDESAASVVTERKSKETTERLAALEVALQAAEENKRTAVAEGRLEDAKAEAKNLAMLKQEKLNLTKKIDQKRNEERPLVTEEHVAQVVARMANVPLSTILSSERERLADLETKLCNHVVGQPRAIEELCEVVRRSRLGLADPKRPKATILFVGPSGTGKTELARCLAFELFGREDALLKLDMSEFAEAHTVSKLVGSPAGYVGYRENTKLTDAVRKRPHGVVLFDEFEKAHPEVQNILLQILEDGKMSDGTGRPVSFRQSYVILTSNLGSENLSKKNLGFGATENTFAETIKQELKERLRPELLNRLDRVIIFNPLEREHMKEILRRDLEEVFERVKNTQRVACSAGNDVLEWLLSQPLPPEEGARAIRRLLEREVT
ncbi:ATP-dependent Clp protease ATP-binding subunit, partial [Patescibacteria group bacterium]|nr:ATP-dependent Clp protease ATP-binding subunit [Patescibacteria group bacterium]